MKSTASNKNNAALVMGLVCIGISILSLFMKWLNIYFLDYTIWEAADMLQTLAKYSGNSEYTPLVVFLYAGAILSIAFFAFDLYMIAKAFLNTTGSINPIKHVGIGLFISACFSALFMLILLTLSKGDLDGAQFTLWPFVNIVVCIIGKIMLGIFQDGIAIETPVSTSNTESEEKPVSMHGSGSAYENEHIWKGKKADNTRKAQYCFHCGAKLKDEARFCGKCGTRIR